MTRIRPVLLGAAAGAFLAVAAGAGLFLLNGPEAEAAGETLPLPPDIPRIASRPAIRANASAMLRQDPEGALTFAESWEAAQGGEGARHCGALALLAMGEPEKAAERLESLARDSPGSAAARAAIFSQAVQAWMMANQSGRAFGAATMGADHRRRATST